MGTMTRTAAWLIAGVMLAGIAMTRTAAAAEVPRVVVTIKPVHALVAGVMQGVATPELLLSGGGSPHSYALKPSQAQSLADARLVVRVSENLETFLNKPIETLAGDSRVLTLDALDGLTLYEVREGGLWEEHDHGDSHDAKKEDGGHGHGHGHGHAESHGGHGHGQGAKREADAHGHRDHAHETDTHIWLDPENALVIVAALEKELSSLWPEHAAAFAANARQLSASIGALDEDLKRTTAVLRGKPYIVFHDAYRYFEERYGLHPAGSITVSPGRTPGAKRLLSIRNRIKDSGAICVFAEPQFEPRLVSTLTEGTDARRAVLDPLGAALPEGQDLYFSLMRGLAADLTACLSPGK